MAKKKKDKGIKSDMMEQEVLQTDELEPSGAPGNEPQTAEEAEGLAGENGGQAELAEALKNAQAKQEEYLNMAQRVQADFENFRRRNQNVRKEAFDDGAGHFAAAMLPVLDNLERAISAAQESADESLRAGVEMVHRQFCEVFAKQGVTVIDRAGEKFDPNLENAVMQASPEDGEPGTVAEVLQKGYQMGSTVLRHAMVKVVPE